MPVVLLCGGKGTRIREASESLPKPMIDVGGKPILWHIMKTYHHYGHRDFVLPLGYKAWTIKEYFLRYRENISDFTVHHGGESSIEFHGDVEPEDWSVTCAYTGLETLTGGRLCRVAPYLADAEVFMLSYGDGVADIDLGALLEAHLDSGRLGTVTAVHPTSRFGELQTVEGRVTDFAEKPDLNQGLVNGGYFVLNRSVVDGLGPDDPMLENGLFQKLTADGELGYYVHEGFWRGMDTYREYTELNRLWDTREAPWRLWD